MFIFISLLKFHGQASRRRNTNGSKQFFKATNIFKVGAESWCTFQFSHIIQFARHFSNLMCWLSSYKANFKCELTNCQFFLKSCIDNNNDNMNFSNTHKRFLNTFHDCCLIRVNALLALRSFEKENNF